MPFVHSSFLLLAAMPGATSSFLFLVAMPGAITRFLLLVAMPGATSSFLLLVEMPGATSSFLFLVAMPGAISRFLLLKESVPPAEFCSLHQAPPLPPDLTRSGWHYPTQAFGMGRPWVKHVNKPQTCCSAPWCRSTAGGGGGGGGETPVFRTHCHIVNSHHSPAMLLPNCVVSAHVSPCRNLCRNGGVFVVSRTVW